MCFCSAVVSVDLIWMVFVMAVSNDGKYAVWRSGYCLILLTTLNLILCYIFIFVKQTIKS